VTLRKRSYPDTPLPGQFSGGCTPSVIKKKAAHRSFLLLNYLFIRSKTSNDLSRLFS
jgi:hypothetical protein